MLAAGLLELVLVLAEAFEVLAELGAHEARVLLEVALLGDHVARRLEDAPLLLLVEELELLLERDVRREDGLHDLRREERVAEPVLERPEVLERLPLRQVLEAFARVQVPPQDVQQRHDGLDLGGRDGRPRREPEERARELLELAGRLEHDLAAGLLARAETGQEEVDLVHLVGPEAARVVVELEDREQELLVARLHALEELAQGARRDEAVVVREGLVQPVELAVQPPHRRFRRVLGLDALRLLDALDLLVERRERHLGHGRPLQARAVHALEELVEHPERLELLGQAGVHPRNAVRVAFGVSHDGRAFYRCRPSGAGISR